MLDNLEALAPRLFREHLVPLGYRLSGSCEGLSFYTASNASHPVLRHVEDDVTT